ncbi:flavin reductase family protein [Saccharothrix obliqua]|uniref:flavin reductase family protein n=1 Tax=Saccharothrix obliqua TaxID=2861747 RepID=UPI001C6009F1|nr:flavin reductase family protein [Saccharothrix obliqua]MBW4716731.1 flavin reductase family protein [Saccharothrix obliqua]
MDLAPELTGVTPTEMRSTLARFATGVVVLTVGGEHMHGMTANAFSSVSLDPPLVLCCVSRTATMHRAITDAGHFATSVLRADQEEHARHFASRSRPVGRAQFDAVDWTPGPRTGAPVLSGALAWLECALTAAHEAGDHSVFIGRVLGSGRGADAAGLLFFDGAYGQVDTSEGRR